ncbi:thiamine-monophosphate kinase [Roseibium sp. TrichSKD4]|uniref:thiamine-phosphate kinase n=1 Tax=Roseibium sp. TrichSKD4 TaxID=744980 RepID=UPI0001E56EDB|nr:thiamine-phosphate kinase [Roseibium sp. TrichSKD4]EFO30358.1 thiamine-monophosphate kinase [Roseibium sp. TrichSKD4]
MSAERPGEFELIRQYFAPLANAPGSLKLTDDAAVMSPRAGFDLVLTKDVLAENVHFLSEDSPEAIAAKALRVNLSDLAAKGARPVGYLLGLALPTDWQANWLERFSNGLAADQAAFDVTLYGGDTIRSSNGVQISITAIGEVPSGAAVRRNGAKAGEHLYVTGTIGDAAAGLKARLEHRFVRVFQLDEAEERHILQRYLLPRPRVQLAPLLVEHANAAMDISDGLLADAAHMAAASNVDLQIDAKCVPLSAAMEKLKTRSADTFLECLNGGDDYEILCSVAPGQSEAFERQAQAIGCPVTKIGAVVSGTGQVALQNTPTGHSAGALAGFSHF